MPKKATQSKSSASASQGATQRQTKVKGAGSETTITNNKKEGITTILMKDD